MHFLELLRSLPNHGRISRQSAACHRTYLQHVLFNVHHTVILNISDNKLLPKMDGTIYCTFAPCTILPVFINIMIRYWCSYLPPPSVLKLSFGCSFPAFISHRQCILRMAFILAAVLVTCDYYILASVRLLPPPTFIDLKGAVLLLGLI